ncbi:hypothetical protein L3C95_15840 [Chitinophaga filiformis]|nr:hypothetical protein [Chitinophaga filiformis]
MENVISKKQKKGHRNFGHRLRTITLEEASNCPFTMKKHNDAVAMLTKYPIPEEILHRKKQQMNNSRY